MTSRPRILVGMTLGLLALVLVVVGLVAAAFAMAQMPWGRHVLESVTARLTRGEVVITGLAGRFPDELRAARVELRDEQGVWAWAEDVAVSWSPRQLLDRVIRVERLHAARAHIARLPRPRADAPQTGEVPRLDLALVDIAHVGIGATPGVLALQGSIRLVDWPRAAMLDVRVARIDAPGSGAARGRLDENVVDLDVDVQEPARGLLANLAGLPDADAVAAQLHLHGRRDTPALQSTLAAGALRAGATGVIDWTAQSLDLDASATAPAMAPRADLRWQAARLQAHVHGPLRAPQAKAQLRVDALAVAGVQVRSLRVDVRGTGGVVDLHAMVGRLRLPGRVPDLLAGSPVDLRATAHLDEPTRPVDFTLAHPLLSARGRALTAGAVQARFSVTAPQLAPFAALAGAALQGQATLAVAVDREPGATHIDIRGPVGVSSVPAPFEGLLGHEAALVLVLNARPGAIDIDRAQLDAANLHASACGRSGADGLQLHWKAAVPRLAAVDPDLAGDIVVDGTLAPDGVSADVPAGDGLRLDADAQGTLQAPRLAAGPIRAMLHLHGLPEAPAGDIALHGSLAGADLALAATVARTTGSDTEIRITRSTWKSAQGDGMLVLRPGEARPQGRLHVQMSQLSDLAPWVVADLRGSGDLAVVLATVKSGQDRASVAAQGRDVTLGGAQATQLRIAGTLEGPLAHPVLAGELGLEGLMIGPFQGKARLDFKGPGHALALDLSADGLAAPQAPAHLDATGVLDVPSGALALRTLRARYREVPLQLLEPAQVSLRGGLAVDRLRVGVLGAVVALAGRFEPALDLAMSVRNDPAAARNARAAAAAAKGDYAIDARITGSLAQSAIIDARLSAGSQATLAAGGSVALAAAGPIDLNATGTIDAGIANAVLAASGRRVRGQVAVDVRLGGSRQAPQVSGSLRVSRGDYEDDNLGLHVSGIEARIRGTGGALQVERFAGQAGPGTVDVSGTFGLLGSSLPVDLQLVARNAQPFASDLVLANVDADIRLRGALPGGLLASGTVKVNRADLTVPTALPPSVGVLDVRWPGQAPEPAAAGPSTVIGLDLKVDAPGAVFVRGRGIDAELAGALAIGGNTAVPQVSGGFDLRRGSFDLAGSRLIFESGRVGFNGTGLNRRIDPTLDFAAQSQSATLTARLAITGYADAPRITLSSTPDMPQDEILAQLLFGTSVSKLTTLQMVQIGSAVVTIGGLGSAGSGVMSAVQKTLGLDRLAVGNTPTGATSVEVGRYVTRNVFVGARQMGAAGGTTQALVQIDITRQLKAVGAFGNGGTVRGATPDNDPGNSIGLLYQIEY